MKAGAYVLHPAGGVHWDGAGDEEVIVQIIGEGPVETTQVGPPGAPQGLLAETKMRLAGSRLIYFCRLCALDAPSSSIFDGDRLRRRFPPQNIS